MSSDKISVRQCTDLLWLRFFGCPVDLGSELATGRRLHLQQLPSRLGTDMYSAGDVTVIAVELQITVMQPFYFQKVSIFVPWAERIAFLPESTKHPGYVCAPPGLWLSCVPLPIASAMRKGRWRTTLLMTVSKVAHGKGEREALIRLSDMTGQEYPLLLTLSRGPLDPEVIEQYSEERIFPSDARPG